jgi:hypothetical protein
MQLFHTSHKEITEIKKSGRFGEFLFFSSSVYQMCAGAAVVYSIEIEENEIIAAGSLFYHEDAEKLEGLVEMFCNRFNVDTDTAEEMISERQHLEEYDADDLWDVQYYTAQAAKILGFRGVRVTDEQGTAYMIDMLDQSEKLQIEA